MIVRQWNGIQPAAAALFLLLLTACASAPQSAQLLEQPQRFSSPRILSDVPFFPQEAYQCGPAALATVLNASSVEVLPDQLVSRVYVPEREGSLQIEMLAAPRSFGRLSYQLDPSLGDVLGEVEQGRPVLVMQNLGLSWYPRWHYAVIIGYDLQAGELILRSGTIRDYRVGLKVFERTWQRAGHWAFVVLAPGELPADPEPSRYFESVAAFEQVQPGEGVEAAYAAGLEQWPGNPALGMGLGNLYYSRGELDRAREVYQALLAKNPEYAIAHNNLAQVLLQTGEHEAALRHAQEAVRLGGRYAETYRATLDELRTR